jgi:thiamine pyrophosphokinase
MTNSFILLSNGVVEEPALLKTRLDVLSGATVIAVDGGFRHARELGLKVDILVGDLDSVADKDRLLANTQDLSLLEFPKAKDETDLELALLHAMKVGADEIVILGALGGRLDMSLANILLLAHPQLAPLRVELWAGNQTAWLLRPPGGSIPGEPGDTVSLIPMVEDATDISTTGFAYALENAVLALGTVRGVSNVITEREARIEFGSGSLLVVHTPGRA